MAASWPPVSERRASSSRLRRTANARTRCSCRFLVARGNRAEALRVYEALRERLRDDLGATPAPELRELQAGLLRR